MRVYLEPPRSQWSEIVKRPGLDLANVEAVVQPILERVRHEGDAALRHYAQQFDGHAPEDFLVSAEELQAAAKQVDEPLKLAIRRAAANIRSFHEAQATEPLTVETEPGVVCQRRSVPIQKVGLYIPGGTAPLFSTVLMLAVPAAVAGCPERVLVTPAKQGHIHPATLFAAQEAGVTAVYRVGGAQAIAALGHGTETVPRVDKIFGPGNQYVTVAKQLLAKEGVAIDMPAGPSEVAVYADSGANADYVAMDLLSQAEHGSDSQVLLVVPDEKVLSAVQEALARLLPQLGRKEMAEQALGHSRAVVLSDRAQAQDLLNEYAAEHLILAMEDAEAFAEGITQAGSVFLGYWTPESVGDYASGTNHTLPTNGAARAFSGVSLDSFVKKITYQRLSPEGLKSLGPAVEAMASAEGLDAHRLAVTLRLRDLNSTT